MLARLWHMARSPVAIDLVQIGAPSRSMATAPGTRVEVGIGDDLRPERAGAQLRRRRGAGSWSSRGRDRRTRWPRPCRFGAAAPRRRSGRHRRARLPRRRRCANGGRSSASPGARSMAPVPLKNHSGAAPTSPAAGRPPSSPERNIRMLSVRSASSLPCIAWRCAALPRCVSPVPETRQCAGSGWSIGAISRQGDVPAYTSS